MKTKIFLFLIFILLPYLLISQTNKYKFFWNFNINENFEVDKYTIQTIIKNGRIIRESEIRDLINLVPIEFSNEKFHLIGKYYSYQKPKEENLPYYLNEIYDLNFYMDKKGNYEVPQGYLMPTIRNIPVFPENEITPGSIWQEKGIEIMEFNPPITIPVDVSYQFLNIDNEKFKFPTAKISFSYIMNHFVEHQYYDIPNKIIGYSYSTLWYNIEKNLPHYIENVYDITFIYPEGTVIEYKGNLKGYYNTKSIKTNIETLKDNIINDIKKQEKDLNIKKTDDGVIIEMGEVYFKYNSDKLTKEAETKLDNIGKALKNYKDFKLIIKGHTDNIGGKNYNKALSEKRAENVLKYLIERGYIKENQGSYKGMGEDEPIADNSTEEGRAKNRRVEIIIIP
jgi:outer membrane protein OmpA-like peptidoglycan-associated protein